MTLLIERVRAFLVTHRVQLIVILVVVVILILTLRACATQSPNIPVATQRSLDSLAITKPTFDSTARAGASAVARDTTRARGYKAQATRTEAVANGEAVRADSLAVVARAVRSADSAATAWHAAYDARTLEAEAWHATAIRNDSAYVAERDARMTLARLYGADTTRRAAIEKVNAELVTAIGKLTQPCRIVGPVPCPSRTATAIGSALLGAVVARKL